MADKQITPFQLTDQFTMDNFNQRINETNIALQSKPNPNLLDNWYFGNPVDQRGGYVVPPGVPYFNNYEGTSLAGYTDAYYQVLFLSDGKKISVDGTEYYIDIRMAVRGYTGAGYGIDRWKINQPVLTILDDSIKLTSSGDYRNFLQVVDNAKLLAGKTVTLSFLYKSTVSTSYCQFNINGTWTSYLQFVKSTEWKLAKLTYTFGSDLTSLMVGISIMANGDIELQAAKLELGSQQTLAHQENGVWVLNEIPDYGEQLARCQRYQWITNADNNMPTPLMYAATINTLVGSVQFPVTMRTKPAVTGVFARNVLTGETLSAFNNDSINAVTNQDGVCYIAGMFSTLTVGGWYQVAAIFNANL